MQVLDTIKYFTEADTEKAFQSARQAQLPVLVDYWAPHCKGCKKMEITTYQSDGIQSYINNHFVFIKYDITNRNAQKIQSSPVLWTPTFIVFSNDGSEVRKTTGYLNEQLFEAEMELGRALAFLRKAQASEALGVLENLLKNTKDDHFQAETLYWAGVASYFLKNRNADNLLPYWQRLLNDYPESIWASKADCLHIKF